MSKQIIRIATRKSPLALWQANHVKAALCKQHPDLQVELVEMTTKGDKILDTPLAKIGGKGLFVKELEQGLLDGHADIAVHSMKDVPMEFPEGLTLAVIMEREKPYDAFVSNHYEHFDDLPSDAIVGTSSLRRQSQLLMARPQLQIKSLRGNVGTRLGKLDSGEFDAIILAAAGLQRLNMENRIRHTMSPELMLPAVGQGAIGIECRSTDQETLTLIQPLNDETTQQRVTAERAMNGRLGGSCQIPIAGFAVVDETSQLHLRGLVADLQGKQCLRSEILGHVTDAKKLGEALADDLIAQGADKLLQSILNN